MIHAILDNYAAHKHPQVLAWLAEHPRWTFHFTPTSCSWLNAVEGFFSKLTRQSLKRGVFRSVDDLESAITRYIAATNSNPKPFVWTATAKIIQAKLTLNHPSESVHEVQTAVVRVLESAIKSGAPTTIDALARALRWMDRDEVVEELVDLMGSGSIAQQDMARLLLSELGGAAAYEKLHALTAATKQYREILDKPRIGSKIYSSKPFTKRKRAFNWQTGWISQFL